MIKKKNGGGLASIGIGIGIGIGSNAVLVSALIVASSLICLHNHMSHSGWATLELIQPFALLIEAFIAVTFPEYPKSFPSTSILYSSYWMHLTLSNPAKDSQPKMPTALFASLPLFN